LGALGRLLDGLGKLAVFGAARSRSYAKLFWLNNNRRFIFISANRSRADPVIGVPFASVSERGEIKPGTAR
jgi:hypothetical protein